MTSGYGADNVRSGYGANGRQVTGQMMSGYGGRCVTTGQVKYDTTGLKVHMEHHTTGLNVQMEHHTSAIPKTAAIFGQANMSWYEHWPLLKWALTGFKLNFILVHKLGKH
jgi:hypothetical protein